MAPWLQPEGELGKHWNCPGAEFANPSNLKVGNLEWVSM